MKNLWRLPTLKLFIVFGIGLFHWAASDTEALVGNTVRPLGDGLLVSFLLGIATWVALSFIWSVTREKNRDHHVDGDPLGWTRASTSGGLHFLLLFPLFAFPFITHVSLFSPLSVAFAGISAATIGITAHLSVFWDLRASDSQRNLESLKIELQTWAAVFSGVIAWTGLLISGALLALAVGAFSSGLRQAIPQHLPPRKMTELLFCQGLPIAYAIATTILWILRPLHRRMEQISDAVAAKGR